MRKRPQITTNRAVDNYREMLWVRRELFDDSEFFTMPQALEEICFDGGEWSVRTYKRKPFVEYSPRASAIEFDGRVVITADEELIDRAKRGCYMANFVLAHELGHLALDHHKQEAVTKRFQLFSTTTGMSNIPPNVEEFEANLAAVFFQCGTWLEQRGFSHIELAQRAHSDPRYVKIAQRYVQLDVFQALLNKPEPESKIERVVL